MTYKVNERIFESLDQIEEKKIKKHINTLYPDVVLRAFPNGKIMKAKDAIDHLKEKTNLDERIIRDSLGELLDRNEIIPARDTNKRLYLSKVGVRVGNVSQSPEQVSLSIFNKLPNEILDHNQLVQFIMTNEGINDPSLIEQSIEILVSRKNLVRVEQNGQVYYKKISR